MSEVYWRGLFYRAATCVTTQATSKLLCRELVGVGTGEVGL